MSNEIHDPLVDYKGLSLRAQEQVRRKFLPLCTEDEKQHVQTTLMPMVHFAPTNLSTPSRHILVNARMDHCPQLLRWAVTCFVYGMDKIEAAKKNSEYVRANREQLARFQLSRGPCIPLPKPPLLSRRTGQKRRASQTQSGDADNGNDGRRRVKSKNPLTQSNVLDSETKKRVREAANESRLMERKSANGSSETDLMNQEANLTQHEADLERNEIELTFRKSAVDSRETALYSSEASVAQREADLERTLRTRRTDNNSRSANLGHSETAMHHLLEALKTKETEVNNRIVFLDTRNIELDNLEAAMDTRATELNNREAAMDIRHVKLKNRDTVLRIYEADLGHCGVVTDGPPANLASRETALESHEIGQDDGQAALENWERNLNNPEAVPDSKKAHLGKQESYADDHMATSVLGASQPDNAHKREKDENSATPQAQTGSRFEKYIAEYRRCYNRAILDIMLLRGLGGAERRTVQDEKFRDALMEEFRERTESLANNTNRAWKLFEYLYRS